MEVFALDAVAQMDGLAAMVGDLNADGVLAGHTFDKDAFRPHREAEVVGQAGDALLLHPCFRLELICRHHRPGIDLHHVAAHIELAAFFLEDAGLVTRTRSRAGRGPSPELNSVLGGRRKPLTDFGATAHAQIGVGALMEDGFACGCGIGCRQVSERQLVLARSG